MTRQPTSLIDILEPPANRWLTELSKRRSDLPPGVRVVRFGEEDDAGVDAEDGIASPPRRKCAPQAKAAGNDDILAKAA